MTPSLQDQILRYPVLSPAEQREVEEHVQDHPDLVPLFEEAQAFTALLHDARRLHSNPLDDEALAYYVATKHLSATPPPALHEIFDRIEAQLASDPALRERHKVFTERLNVLDATVDPVRQFERLTGHQLAPPRPPAQVDAPEPTRLRQVRAFSLRMAAGLVVLCLTYGVLAFISARSVSLVEHLATFTPAEVEADGLRTRSAAAPDDVPTSEALYLQALPLLRDARTSTLGLFPRYEAEALTRAASLLEQVAAGETTDPVLRLEARYLLAKVHLAQNDVPAAAALLQSVAVQQSWRSLEAAALLDALEEIED